MHVGLHPSALSYLSLPLWPHLDSFLGAMSSAPQVARPFLAGSPLLPPAQAGALSLPCSPPFLRGSRLSQGCAVSLLSDSWEALLETCVTCFVFGGQSHQGVGPFSAPSHLACQLAFWGHFPLMTSSSPSILLGPDPHKSSRNEGKGFHGGALLAGAPSPLSFSGCLCPAHLNSVSERKS